MKINCMKLALFTVILLAVNAPLISCNAAEKGSFKEKRIEIPEGAYAGFFARFSKGLAIFNMDTESENGGLYVSTNDGTSYRRKKTAETEGVPDLDCFNTDCSDITILDLVMSYRGKTAVIWRSESIPETLHYLYADSDGTVFLPELIMEKENPIVRFFFASDETLLACGEKQGVYRVDLETGNLESLIETEGTVTELFCMGTVLGCMDSQRAYFYDLEKNVQRKEEKILSKFVKMYQAECGEDTEEKGYSKKKSIAVCGSSEDDQVLYLACEAGVFRYQYGGTVIVQILDGKNCALQNSGDDWIAVRVRHTGEIQVLFDKDQLYSYAWKIKKE